MIRFRCPHCQVALSAHDHAAGAAVACKSCRKPMRVPVPVAEESPAPNHSRGGIAFFLAALMIALGAGGYCVYDRLKNDSRGVAANESDEKGAFLKIVRQNADDPGDLEIVTWGERADRHRGVTFRCRRVGLLRVGRQRVPAGPVMLEQATIEYDGNRIAAIHCDKTFQVWHPK